MINSILPGSLTQKTSCMLSANCIKSLSLSISISCIIVFSVISFRNENIRPPFSEEYFADISNLTKPPSFFLCTTVNSLPPCSLIALSRSAVSAMLSTIPRSLIDIESTSSLVYPVILQYESLTSSIRPVFASFIQKPSFVVSIAVLYSSSRFAFSVISSIIPKLIDLPFAACIMCLWIRYFLVLPSFFIKLTSYESLPVFETLSSDFSTALYIWLKSSFEVLWSISSVFVSSKAAKASLHQIYSCLSFLQNIAIGIFASTNRAVFRSMLKIAPTRLHLEILYFSLMLQAVPVCTS